MLFLMPATLVLGYRLGLVAPRSPRLPSEKLVPPKWLVATLSTLTLISMVASGLLLRFDYDFANTSPSLEELETIKEKEQDIYPVFFGPQAIYVARNLAALDEALSQIEELQDRPDTYIRSVSSVRDFAPSREHAAERIELIEEIQSMLSGRWVRRVEDPDRVRLIDDVLAFQVPSLDAMPRMADLPASLLDPLVARDGSGELVLGLTAKGNPKDGRITMEFTRELYELRMPETVRGPTGDKPVLAEVLWLVSSEGPLIIVLTFLGIFVLVIIDRRDVQQATWVLVPLVASLLLTFGTMIALGWKVNFFNMVVLPSLLGLGVDHGVHYYRRWRELGCRTAETQLELFEPITVATLTTIMGYAGMALANHPGLRSIGNLAIVGLTCTWITAMVLLPGLLSWREAHHSLDPEDADDTGEASTENVPIGGDEPAPERVPD
jgi:predicted RND superfamily exporter protein